MVTLGYLCLQRPSCYLWTSRGDLPPMSTPRILQRLYTLGNSSPDLLRNIYCLIQYDEKEQYLISLQGSELARLVKFLDEVHVVPSVFH